MSMKQIKYMSYNKNKMIKRLVILPLVSVIAFSAFGQGTERDYNEEVTIRGSYDPTINQAFKINTKPETFSLTLKNPEFVFESIEVEQPTQITLEPIDAAKIRTDRKAKIYNNYLKLGIGSWVSPYIDFAHSSGSKDAVFNASIFHLSSFRNIPDYSPSPYSNSRVNVGWKKLMNNHVFSISAGYGLNTNRYYGYKPDDFPNITMDEDNLKQMFNLIKANVGFKSQYKKESKLHHAFNVSAYYYFDKFKTSETNAQFDFDLHKAFSVTKLLNFQHLGLEGKVEYYGNKDTIKSNTDVLIEGTPYFKAKYGIVNFLIGLRFAYLSSSNSIFAFNPIVKADLNIIPEALTIYAGIGGGLEKNSFLNLSDKNPWVSSVIPLEWQNNKFDISGGVRGNIARQLGFNLQARFVSFKNMGFFVNTSESKIWGPPIPMNKFNVFYDDGNVTNFSGELTYQFGTDIKIWLNGEYNIYNLDSLTQPYHKPISLVSLGGSWLIKKKVNVWLEATYAGQRYAVDNELLIVAQEITLDGFFDLNLGLSYNITKDFSVWLSGTNLLNKNYQRYYNYPVQGLEIMGGIGLRF